MDYPPGSALLTTMIVADSPVFCNTPAACWSQFRSQTDNRLSSEDEKYPQAVVDMWKESSMDSVIRDPFGAVTLKPASGTFLRYVIVKPESLTRRFRTSILFDTTTQAFRGGRMSDFFSRRVRVILNTTTMQELLGTKPACRTEVERRFSNNEYEPVMECVNQLFHEFTSGLPPFFREDCVPTLTRLLELDAVDPVVLTNSRGDKVRRKLTALGMPLQSAEMLTTHERAIRILGDVRQ